MLDSLVHLGPWIPVLVWVILYFSDFFLTLKAARLYQETIRQHLVFEGSYELNPYFEDDVNRLRGISPRFLKALVLSAALLIVLWYLASFLEALPLFSLGWGAMVLLQAAVHVRHLRNLSLFDQGSRHGGLEGKILYRRWLLMRNSAAEFFTFAGLFGILAALYLDLFFLGGALSCLATGAQHRKMGMALWAERDSSPPSPDS